MCDILDVFQASSIGEHHLRIPYSKPQQSGFVTDFFRRYPIVPKNLTPNLGLASPNYLGPHTNREQVLSSEKLVFSVC